MNDETRTQWLTDHLDNIRTIMRGIGRDLVQVSDIQIEDSETESEEYYDA